MSNQHSFPLKYKAVLFLTTISLSLTGGLSPVWSAPIPLTQATLRKIVNQVKLLLYQQRPQEAKVGQSLRNIGDAVKTQQAARAELKFNDGTLAKVGELSTFSFTPNTRRFDLGNGTYLFLVPPNHGNTDFYTPNAKAGVRGSALFIRYNKKTNTTTMGALTNNPLGPMSITAGGQQQDLYAGQMATVVENHIERVENFDLSDFLGSSSLYRDVDFTDPDLQAVHQEVADGVTTQRAGLPTIVPPIAIIPSPTTNQAISNARPVNRALTGPEISQARENLNINLNIKMSPIVPFMGDQKNPTITIINPPIVRGNFPAITEIPIALPVIPPVLAPNTPAIPPITVPLPTPPPIVPIALPVIPPVLAPNTPVIPPITVPLPVPPVVVPPIALPVIPPVLAPIAPVIPPIAVPLPVPPVPGTAPAPAPAPAQ